VRGEGARALDGCQPADTVFFEMSTSGQRKNSKDRGLSVPLQVPARPRTFVWVELRSNAGGAVEVAFDNDNGDVITETNIAAKVCRAVKDVDREFFRRE
jgi:hypothetical protein